MQKPITIARREFSDQIVEAVNGSGLPFFIIRHVLEDVLGAVRQGEEAQEQKDRAEYEKYLQETAAQHESENASKTSETEG